MAFVIGTYCFTLQPDFTDSSHTVCGMAYSTVVPSLSFVIIQVSVYTFDLLTGFIGKPRLD